MTSVVLAEFPKLSTRRRSHVGAAGRACGRRWTRRCRRRGPALRAFADRLAARSKAAKVVLVAVCRKLAVIANAVLSDRKP